MTRHAFTLLELLVVTVIMTLIVTMTIMNLDGVSDHARLRAAAAHIGVQYRMAASQADHSGTPRVLVFDRHGSRLSKPQKVQGQWTWSEGAHMQLPSKVKIHGVQAVGGDGGTEDLWRISINPGALGHAYVFDLGLNNGRRGQAILDSATMRATLSLAEGEDQW